MAEKCYHCFRPKETCYCKDILPFDTEIHFVFLMHPKEAYKQKTGTGRLASLSLKNSEILIVRMSRSRFAKSAAKMEGAILAITRPSLVM